MQLRMSVFQATLQALLTTFTSGQESIDSPIWSSQSSPSIPTQVLHMTVFPSTSGQESTHQPVWSSQSITPLPTLVLNTAVDAVFTSGNNSTDSPVWNSQSLPTQVLKMTKLQCAELTECLPWKDCPVFSDEMERLRVTPWKSLEYVEKSEELRTWICNMEERRVCCDTDDRVELLVAGGSRTRCGRWTNNVFFLLA